MWEQLPIPSDISELTPARGWSVPLEDNPMAGTRGRIAFQILTGGILAGALIAFWAISSAMGAELEFKRVPEKEPKEIQISGGTGRQIWRVRYGTSSGFAPQAQLVPVERNRAWFSHGGWLRLIDTEKGLVAGRWHFPGQIVRVVPSGNHLQIDVEDKSGDQVFRRTLTFDPSAAAAIPYWPTGSLSLIALPRTEVESLLRVHTGYGVFTGLGKIPASSVVKEDIAELEGALRRDLLSPMFQVALGRLLRDTGDPQRAKQMFESALQVPTTDFTELLPISGFLERLGERELARTAFERGYQNFLERGNDPRLLLTLFAKMILYQPWVVGKVDLTTDYGRELMERSYKLSPYCEAAELAWTAYSDILEKNGRAEDARVWRARAEEAAPTSTFLFPRKLGLIADRAIQVILASILAGLLYMGLVSVRLWHQRRADWASLKDKGWLARRFRTMEFPYWSRSQRFAFFTIVLSAWIAAGLLLGITQGIIRSAASPIASTTGSLASPVTTWHLENRLPPSPERDLFLAIAYQQSGEKDKAERLYRSLPNFAEGWNNLGVLLREGGKEQEARQAFEQALRLDPKLGEAALNLGRPPQTLWTELHQKYLPGRPMLAPPRPGRMTRMFLGGSLGEIALHALAGPFAGPGTSVLYQLGGAEPPGREPMLVAYLLVAALVFALALFFIPSRVVTNAPPRIQTVFEVVFPGISPGWSFVGGLALVAWIYFLLQSALLFRMGTPYIFMAVGLPSLHSYGIPKTYSSNVFVLINPSWIWVYAAPILLFAVNLVLVVWAKLRHS